MRKAASPLVGARCEAILSHHLTPSSSQALFLLLQILFLVLPFFFSFPPALTCVHVCFFVHNLRWLVPVCSISLFRLFRNIPRTLFRLSEQPTVHPFQSPTRAAPAPSFFIYCFRCRLVSQISSSILFFCSEARRFLRPPFHTSSVASPSGLRNLGFPRLPIPHNLCLIPPACSLRHFTFSRHVSSLFSPMSSDSPVWLFLSSFVFFHILNLLLLLFFSPFENGPKLQRSL